MYPIDNDDQLDPAAGDANAAGDDQQSAADPGQAGGAAPAAAAATPAQPRPQRQAYTAPDVQTPSQIARAKQSAAQLDETLGAGGQLKQLIDDMAGVTETVYRENVQLRDRVDMQGQGIDQMDFWTQHDADPQNKDYPSSAARADFQKDLASARDNYAHMPAAQREGYALAEARGRYFSRLDSRRAASASNKDADGQQEDAPETRPVGSRRPIPRGLRQAPPQPVKKLTVQEYLDQGKVPPGYSEDQINAEFK